MRIAHPTTSGPTPPSPAEPLRALLVDHDEDSRKLYAESMKPGAWTVVEASDGRQALAKAIAERPDIIVTEAQLPGISGCDLCSLLRRDAETRSIPIVVVVGEASPLLIKRATDAGADVVLTRPCLPERLLGEATRLIARGRRLDAGATMVRPADAASPPLADGATRSERSLPRLTQSRAHQRRATTTPPTAPPAVVCPTCDRLLAYQRSHVGGVSARHQEQWDYFECPAGCGTFQYRVRTRKLKQLV